MVVLYFIVWHWKFLGETVAFLLTTHLLFSPVASAKMNNMQLATLWPWKLKKKTQTHKLTKQSKKICCCWNEILKLAIVIEHLSRQIELNWDSVDMLSKRFYLHRCLFMEVFNLFCIMLFLMSQCFFQLGKKVSK